MIPAVRRLCLALLLAGLAAAGVPGLASDAVPPPPASEAVISPSGDFMLRLRAAKDWQRERPRIELTDLRGGARQVLWLRALPHELRPRFGLVADSGRVLLLDEWWNIQSGRAVMLLDSRGETVATHGYEAVRAALGVDDAALQAGARFGPWIAGRPELAPDGRTALVPVAEGALVVDLETGALSARP